MEKMILSLKNVYMTLMTEDFPIYSPSVIGRAERKGQTMIRFWQRQIVPEFRCMPRGKMIWRNDGKRNRYTSYLCNRSAEIRTYSEYAGELASQICVSSLINQINQFGEFLSHGKYRHDILMHRIQELIRLTRKDDLHLTAEIEEQIVRTATQKSHNAQEKLFQASYLLTFLMLYAAAGEAMDDASMSVLRQKEYNLEALWNIYTHPKDQEVSAVTFLTAHSGIIQDNPLPQHRFFGREEELFNLKELAATKQKCLITGMGGIGKTELLRQLICRCVDDKTVDKIAVVPYENSIVESFVRAFPGFQRKKPEDGFSNILHYLQKESKQGKVLLLIDNLTNGVKEDPDLEQLCLLDCAILITTRRNTLEGFETYSLVNPTVRTGALIFRDNYGSPLSEDDQTVLTRMLEEEMLCHPLTLRLMARAARGRKWSASELEKNLRENGLSISWQEEDREVGMKQLYRQLYSYMQLPKEYHIMAELFTVLPRDSYSAPFLCRYFPDITGSEAELSIKLNAMSEGGWLETDEEGWSMHPLIVQCLRKKSLPENQVASLFGTISQILNQQGVFKLMSKEEPELQRICGIFVHGAELLTGSISREMMKSILQAFGRIMINRKANISYLRILERLMKRCRTQDDEIRILYYTVQGNWHGGAASDFMSVYEQQKQKLTVSDELLQNFCYFAGQSLIFQKEYALAEKLLMENLSDDVSATQKAASYYMLTANAEHQGDAEKFLSLISQGADYVKCHPECDEDVVYYINSTACGAYVKFGMQDAARPLAEWISERIGSRTDPEDQCQYDLNMGNFELHFGDPEKALEYYQRAQKRELYWENDPNYFGLIGQTAIALQRLKRFDEALDVYLNLLKELKENDSAYLLHVYSNNIAVVYLELGRPKEALLHLETAMIHARQYGGIALAETQRNRARAFGLLGNSVEELACLKESAPLLEEAYGAEHPRAQAARQRLAELENH